MRILVACLAFMAAACGAPQGAPETPPPAQAEQPAITIADAWAAPTPAGVNVGAGYLTLTNTQAAADTLIGVEAPRASRAEIHEMAMENGVMRMRRADALDLPAGETVTLAPGGLHLMFFDIATPFAAGETIEVRLRFANAGEVVAQLPVRARENGGHSGH